MSANRSAPAMSLVLFAKNKSRVSAFYEATLGLAVAEDEASHRLLVGPGIELVIHAIPPRYAKDIRITKPPLIRQDTPMKAVFRVKDLEAVRVAAEACGGGLKAREQAWLIRGSWRLDGFDPEGNVVQFRQTVAHAKTAKAAKTAQGVTAPDSE